MGKIILASSSPRRAEILKKNGYRYEIIPSVYDEPHTQTVFSADFIEKIAYNKAKSVIPFVDDKSIIIGADTMVVIDSEILGKPREFDEAFKMLRKLSGRCHKVVTAVAVIDTGTGLSKCKSVTSEVEFFPLTDIMIEDYITKFQPYDKAGSYGIQEMPEGYIKSYKGSLDNIIGLCPETLKKMLEYLNYQERIKN